MNRSPGLPELTQQEAENLMESQLSRMVENQFRRIANPNRYLPVFNDQPYGNKTTPKLFPLAGMIALWKTGNDTLKTPNLLELRSLDSLVSFLPQRY